MITYSLITKPVRVMRKEDGLEHTLIHLITGKTLYCHRWSEFWACKVWSNEIGRSSFKSIMFFNSNFIATFDEDSDFVKQNWNIVHSDKVWTEDMIILQTEFNRLTIFTDGRIPDYVPLAVKNKEKG